MRLPRLAQAASWLLSLCLVPETVSGQHYIRLEDIVAGGDGSGNAPAANIGLDPTTGAFTTSYFAGPLVDTDRASPIPVPGSPYIDSVFILWGRVPTAEDGCGGCYVQYITRSNVQLWMDDTQEWGSTWNYILKDRVGGVSEPGIRVGNRDYFTTAIGLHAAMGITFDLDQLRARHGDAAVGCFNTLMGMDDCSSGYVHILAMLSNDASGVTDSRQNWYFAGQGESVQMQIPREARYLTLVSAPVWGGNINCGHATFARPVITPLPCPPPSDAWLWGLRPSRVSPGGEPVVVKGEALYDGYSVRVGGVDLLNQQYWSDNERYGITPPLAAGFYDVEVVWQGTVIASLPRAVEVTPPPVLTSVTPSTVLLDRATPVTIRGTDLRSDMAIFVRDIQNDSNDLPLLDQRFVSEGVITGSLPPVPPGQGPGPRSLLLLDQDRRREDWGVVTYVASGIERVEPATVSTEGGTEVTFFGFNLSAAASFRLGGQPLTGVVTLDANRVRGISPPLPAGAHPAQLADAQGATLFTLDGAVVAVQPAPLAIASINPSRVYSLGGAVVTIVTTASHGGATPRVDGALFVNAEVVDAVTLRGEVPPLVPGFHDIDLVNADEGVIAAAPHGLEALSDPGIAITAVSSVVVSTLGGTEVTFTGTGFSEGFIPRLGGKPLDGVVFEGTTRLRGTTQPLEPGQHRAAIHGGELRLAVWAGSVAAVEPAVPEGMYIGQVRPARLAAGGSLVRFVGTSFPGDLVPRIGGMALEDFRALSPCRYEGKAPVLPPGLHVADLFRPGFGIVAELQDLVEVAAPGAAPKPSHIVSARVLADGSTRLYVFGHDFTPETVITVGGRPLSSPVFISDELIVGNAPPLASGEALGLRAIAASDGRGTGILENGVRYQEPEPTGGTSFVRGDPNQSGKIDLSDAVYILGFLFLGNPTSIACLDAADADASGNINLTDAIYVLQFLFLSGREPALPFPACGSPATAILGCGSFSACGGGAGGGLPPSVTLCSNVKTLEEAPANPLDPVVVEIAPEGLEIVIRDPPGGKDVAPGDVIVGPTPLRTDAVHNGVAYMLKLEEAVSGSCLAAGDGGGAGVAQDKVFRVRPARFDEVISDGAVRFKQDDLAGAKVSYHKLAKGALCEIVNVGAGGGAGDPGQGQGGVCVGDCVAFKVNQPKDVIDFDDGTIHLKAGFKRCEVDYLAGTEMELEFSLRKLKKFKVFSGARLDSTILFYVEARAHGDFRKEESLKSYQKDELIVLSVFGVPVIILIRVQADLLVGVEMEADINMNLDVGAEAHFKAGMGVERVDGRVRNINFLDPPTLKKLDGTPTFNLDGFASVKGYLRPEAMLFGGLYIKALTGRIKLSPKLFARARVEGHTNPPCLKYGVFAGGKIEVHPEIQFFGTDSWDPAEPFKLEGEYPILNDEVGCKLPPVVRLSHSALTQGGALVIHLDASGSFDPDGGPLNFRWDFDSDGVCDRNTGSDPRTTYVYDPPPGSPCRTFDCSHEITLRVTDDEQTYTERKAGFRTTGAAAQIRRANVLTP